MTPLVIERPKLNDRELIKNLIKVVLVDTWTKNGLGHLTEEIEEEIQMKWSFLEQDFDSNGIDRTFLIAKMDEQVVGTIEHGKANDTISACGDAYLSSLREVGTVFIHPDFQGKGIGKALLEAMVRMLRDKGEVKYCLDSGYKTAQKIWNHLLGTPKYILKDYWGAGLDHFVWEVEIKI